VILSALQDALPKGPKARPPWRVSFTNQEPFTADICQRAKQLAQHD
jgi:hypothetical protein